MAANATTLGFEMEWFDPMSSMMNTIYMKYYMDNNTIELLHSKMKTPFLARIHYPEVELADLFVGNSVTIFNRLLVIKGYANTATKAFMAAREVHFVAYMEGSAKQQIGALMQIGTKHELISSRARTTGSSIMEGAVQVNAGDIVVEFVSTSGASPEAFLKEAKALNAGVSVMVADVDLINTVFEACTAYFPKREFCTLCLIKPHVLKEKKFTGPILQQIVDSGFSVDSMVTLHLDNKMGDYLMDVYRGIYPEYTAMMQQLLSGPMLAVMVSGGPNVVAEFRDMCGPLEPELGKKLRPKSLRAQYGTNLACNAVHCTDLEEDGATECTYIFDTIANI